VSGADSGLITSEPFATFDRDTLSWRTSQLSLSEDLSEFSVTWPRSGTMRSGKCFLRVPWVLHTHGNGCGYWPTPRASEWKGTGPLGSRSHIYRASVGYLDATVQEREQRTGEAEPGLDRLADGVPAWAHRLRAIGNAIVPQCACVIFRAIQDAEERSCRMMGRRGAPQEGTND
jgi:hypothetical protein